MQHKKEHTMPNVVEMMDTAYDQGREDGRTGRPYNPPTTRLEVMEYNRGFAQGRYWWLTNGGL